MMGHYEGGGYCWKPGEVPLCSICQENIATRTAAYRGIHLCDSPECACSYVAQECDAIEYFEDDDE